jgi:hypothetical protein
MNVLWMDNKIDISRGPECQILVNGFGKDNPLYADHRDFGFLKPLDQ